ncbi:hypothetical protein [Pilimelia columellifera]|uniref:Uncharacterized protein n=1 Tax=Pilimelia columellifera subsp. columellifera TaxID=706583 RepID=A0ABN3MYW3_9ACTN
MGLEAHRDRRFRHRERRAQLVGIWLVAALLVAGVLGLFGATGPLSARVVGSADRMLSVEYQRFPHQHAETSIRVTVPDEAVRSDRTAVGLSASWMDATQVSSVSPEAVEQIVGADGIWLALATTPGASLTLTINYRPTDAGSRPGWVQVGTSRAAFHQFVYL